MTYVPRPLPRREREPRLPITYAPHLRARVSRARDGVWYMEIINHRTEQVIAWDNGYASLEEAIEVATLDVVAARIAWMRGFGRKSLR